ncbi:MAG: glutamine-hydrolyzing carbamoyl-phosphate synthase small subunit [Proteobacteria bacterium]|nr:glutamine-hydrolyzing carbamoyl-phosphate synthase small subunit [Pseudomonadota bacterium]
MSASSEQKPPVPCVLVLESGRVFRGTALGAEGVTFGEAVFNTSMTGYQEILTDPSYAGQIVVMTASHIGNTGINSLDVEASRPLCAGFAVREASSRASNWRREGDLDGYLVKHGIVGIEGIDTRALTRALRTGGAQRAAIASGIDSEAEVAQLLERVHQSPDMEGRDLASAVTCQSRYERGPGDVIVDWRHRDDPTGRVGGASPTGGVPDVEFRVAAYDFGIKQNILRDLARVGCHVTVLPAHTPADEALALDVDGYFLSNGPGDPAAVTYAVESVRRIASAGKPVFGICLGHQILALAMGARTYKLRFGHHGGNHPVKDLNAGTIAITAQNHGFAVDRDSLPDGVVETHRNLYDGTVEGLRVVDRPVFSVQYHPEASPGPHDANQLFGRFVEAMRDAR